METVSTLQELHKQLKCVQTLQAKYDRLALFFGTFRIWKPIHCNTTQSQELKRQVEEEIASLIQELETESFLFKPREESIRSAVHQIQQQLFTDQSFCKLVDLKNTLNADPGQKINIQKEMQSIQPIVLPVQKIKLSILSKEIKQLINDMVRCVQIVPPKFEIVLNKYQKYFEEICDNQMKWVRNVLTNETEKKIDSKTEDKETVNVEVPEQKEVGKPKEVGRG
ncbi:Hypothetical_protein [Hexamita inflata]|uniref:Hypothetical_protein n=1 Tax=Hexamita inflata TaxID=28002 RepID=A0AA86QU94_9EUKA|nr:Hypothetical protein HINF_LOCUS53796 [Hexamita inflata]